MTTNEILYDKLMHAPMALRALMAREMEPYGDGREEGHGQGHGPGGHGPGHGHGHGFGQRREMGMGQRGPGRHGRPGGPGPERFGEPPFGGRRPQGGPAPLSRERVLVELLDAEEGMRQKEIAAKLGVNSSSTSEFIDRLEDDGYLTREVDPADKRATRILLTEKGRARAAEIQDEQDERFAAVFGGLTEEEKLTLIGLLDRIFPARV